MNNEPYLVGIAQIAVARAPERLCCLGLGSCVAVFVYDIDLRIGGVLHVLLPKAPARTETVEKYADTGVKKLVNEVLSKGARKQRLRAKLVGGAQMFPNLDLKMSDIGSENVAESKKALKELGILVIAEDVQGTRGRSVVFDLRDGRATVSTAFGTTRVI